jgi:hypothetical protein
MTKYAVPLLFGLACAAAPAAAPAASTIKPGYWESTSRVLSPIRSEKVENRCITPADVDKFMLGPSNRHYVCTYPTRSFKGGKILLKGACVSKKGRQVQVEGHGAYTPTSFTLTADVAMEFGGLPINGRAETEARRIGDVCPTPPPVPPAEPAQSPAVTEQIQPPPPEPDQAGEPVSTSP